MAAVVRVLWLNAHCLPLVTSRAHARAVADYVLAIVRRDPVDAVAMCEVWGVARGVIARALESESEEWIVALAPRAAPRASSGLLLAWRRAPSPTAAPPSPVAGPSSLAFGICRMPDCLAAKGVLGVKLRFGKSSRDVWLAATHLQNGHPTTTHQNGQPTATVRQLGQLLKWVDDQAGDRAVARVVVGDFNLDAETVRCVLDSKTIVADEASTLRQLGQLLGWARGQAGDRAAAVVVGDFNLEPDAVRREAAPRWRVAAPGVPTVPGEGAELDFALVRGGDVVRCAVVDSPRSPSDHIAVITTIKWKESQSQ